MHPAVERLRHGLIVSCQASASDIIYGSDAMAAMAAAAQAGGAVGIRANGASDIAAIRASVSLPILGIFKQDLPGLGIRITPDLEAARVVVRAGADIVAVDATKRNALEGRLPSADLIRQIKRNLNVPVMADIATFEEGVAAAEAGADIVATTLSGYTDYTPHMRLPDFDLVSRLAQAVQVPVIAEGRIASVEHALEMFRRGVYAIVIGSMVTRPKWITQQYVEAVDRFQQAQASPIAVADVGGTKLAFAVIDAYGQVIDYAKHPTQAQEGGDAVLRRIGDHLNALVAAHPGIRTVGVSSGGVIDADGQVIFATNFMPGWKGQHIRAKLEAYTGLPVAVANDGACAALGEALYGAGRGYARSLTLTVGTGVGGGVVIDGQLYGGASRAAVSLGHIGIVRDGAPCPCGRHGCLEAYVSGAAFVREYNSRAAGSDAVTTGEAVAERAAQGDAAAVAALDALADWLGYGLASLSNLFDPSVFILGGGIAEIGEPFFERVRAALAQYGGAMTGVLPVIPAGLGTRAGLLGAAALARQHLIDQ